MAVEKRWQRILASALDGVVVLCVVVPAFNEEDGLADTLEALLNQTVPPRRAHSIPRRKLRSCGGYS